MLKIFILLCGFYLHVSALELSYAKGNFGYDFGLNGVMDASVNMDVNVLSLKESHLLLSDKIYLYGVLDIYNSDKLDDMASYVNKAADYSPFGFSASDVASSMGAPVPVSFEMRGIDMSIALAYEIYQKDESYIALGLASGFSMPYIETENMLKDAQLFQAILKKTKTEIMTYKLMPTLQGYYSFNPMFSLEASLMYGYQYGSISNDYISGDASFSGSVIHSDIALKIKPIQESKLFLSLGYRSNSWDVQSMDVSIINPALSHDFAQELSLGFDSQLFYLGAGYRF